MSSFSIIAISALFIMSVSLIGVIFAEKHLSNWVNRNMAFLVSFSAGVLLATSLFITKELFEHTPTLVALASIIGGFLLFLLLQRFIPESHHHHHEGESANCPVPHRRGGALRMLVGDALHNIGDGIILVPAFLLDLRLGIATTVSIFFHEIFQEISEFFVLRHHGFSIKKALVSNVLVSCTIFIGVALGLYLTSFELLQGILLGIAAGGFLFIVFYDLIPYHEISQIKQSSFWKHVLAFMGGIVILGTIHFAIPHNDAAETIAYNTTTSVAITTAPITSPIESYRYRSIDP